LAWAAGITVFVAVFVAVAALIAVVRRRWRSACDFPGTEALGPALLAGWAVAMVAG
jgi:hypothetical protein